MKSKIIVIVGPTATGKTSLSIELAKEYNAEIINADATGVYTEPLIATAKIKETEKQGIIHHMIDLISLNDDYSIYEYQEKGRELLNNLIKNNKNIIIVGGSGLYIKALLYDYKLDKTEQNKIDLSQYSNEELISIANGIDINNNIHINNRKRLERYISYYKKTGKIISKTDSINNKLYDFDLIGLKTSREELYNRINKRVEDMFNDGLLEEAKDLYNKNLKNFSNIIGYKELNMYFKNIITLEEAKELIKQNTRKYAKRQLTWFNNQMNDIVWFDVNYSNFNITIGEIKKYLKN
jgi:tRNA dimethylallyltransferase